MITTFWSRDLKLRSDSSISRQKMAGDPVEKSPTYMIGREDTGSSESSVDSQWICDGVSIRRFGLLCIYINILFLVLCFSHGKKQGSFEFQEGRINLDMFGFLISWSALRDVFFATVVCSCLQNSWYLLEDDICSTSLETGRKARKVFGERRMLPVH